jgi:formate dehydrogenase iron-sulfur subunit
LDTLREHAHERVNKLQQSGLKDAYLYGADAVEQPGTEGLNAFFLLVDKPEVYNLPPDPVVPTKKVKAAWLSMAVTAAAMAVVAIGSALFAPKNGTAE